MPQGLRDVGDLPEEVASRVAAGRPRGGSKSAATQRRNYDAAVAHALSMPGIVRCAECDWSHDGPMREGIAANRVHAEEAHGRARPRPDPRFTAVKSKR
jgi:hypothetical protein